MAIERLPRIRRRIRIILSLDAENADLKARVAFQEPQFFGPRSEKMTAIDPTQATLGLGDLSDIPAAANDDVAPGAEGPRLERRSPSTSPEALNLPMETTDHRAVQPIVASSAGDALHRRTNTRRSCAAEVER